MAMEQRIVVFHGNVQGVGFRYTACRTAGGYDVTGYVRNMPDGSVECLVEGESAQVEAFISDLAGRMRRYITSQRQSRGPHTGRFTSFGVEF
ncbi:MAG: acylphosphatase [Phycisphaerae bacterium]